MTSLRQISFVLEEFKLGSPGQQLLDRFLLGFPSEGRFHRMPDVEIVAHLTGGDDGGFALRVKQHPLVNLPTLQAALANADAIVLAGASATASTPDQLIADSLAAAPPHSRFFVYGTLGTSRVAALAHAERAKNGKIELRAGTTLPFTPRLPDVELALGTRIQEALIVVPGPANDAVLDGVSGLLPIVERRAGGESGVTKIQMLTGDDVWLAGQNRSWSWPLLAAAISRSDSPLGDPVKDGRTQDIVGLRLLAGLVPKPRAWLLEHRDGLRSAILDLEGAVGDINFALRTRGGKIISAQLYRPPPPAEHHYSSLAAVLARFFAQGTAPWSAERDLLLATSVAQMRESLAGADVGRL